MSKLLLFRFFAFYLLLLFFHTPSRGCGFAYISSCGTYLKLKVNDNPLKLYSAANCGYMTPLHGKDLGVVNELRLEDATTQSWQSCLNNVMNGNLYYRVYLTSNISPGAFIVAPLTDLELGGSGAYTNKEFSLANGIDLLNGLQAGQNYFLELYFKNDVDLNQDNIADSLLLENNAGLNFKATFQTSGTTGGVIVTFPQKTNVSCNASVNGQITAAASGGSAPYTYLWSNGSQGASISNLPPGTYTVTATSGTGTQGIGFTTITAPPPIVTNITITNVTSSSATNGSLIASVSGGIAGYSYQWTTVGTTNVISNLGIGSYTLTVTDANSCTNTKTASIIVSSGIPPQNYCQSYSGAPWNDWIKVVSLGEINNTSSKTVYSDFTSLTPANLTIGVPYTMSITSGEQYYTTQESFRVWVDFNRDGIFQDLSEVVLVDNYIPPPSGISQLFINHIITIPAGALVGPTRMRVAMKNGSPSAPCEQFIYGEVEDYLVNIIDGGPSCLPSVLISNILCNNNDTPSNPADDTFTFTINVTGTGAIWNANINGTLVNGTFGTPKIVGPFPISGNVLNFTVVNATNPACFKAVAVTPPTTCSNTVNCSITANASSISCNNNGTLSNPADDTYTFNLNVNGTGTGTGGWTAVINGINTTGNYNTPKLCGPIAISAGVLNITVRDAQKGTCSANVTVTPPPTCSSGNPPPAYCPSVSAFPWEDYVKRVAVGTIDKLSGKTPYSNFTSLSTSIAVGQTLPISITAGFSYMYQPEYVRAWIDFNRNGNFEAVEIVYSTSLSVVLGAQALVASGTITVPLGTTTGTTRMRVIAKSGGFSNGCDPTIARGEVEDYTINITAASANLQANELHQEENENLQKVANLVVYPNPVLGQALNINLIDYTDQPVQLELVHPTGYIHTILSIEKVSQDIYTIDASVLQNGYYFFVVKSPSFRTQTRSVVVVRE